MVEKIITVNNHMAVFPTQRHKSANTQGNGTKNEGDRGTEKMLINRV